MKASAERQQHRVERLTQLAPTHAATVRHGLIARWCQEYSRRLGTSQVEADDFRRQKDAELLRLGGTKTDLRTFSDGCAARRLAAADLQAADATKVPSHLIGNYEAVEVFGLREIRTR